VLVSSSIEERQGTIGSMEVQGITIRVMVKGTALATTTWYMSIEFFSEVLQVKLKVKGISATTIVFGIEYNYGVK
jgi:hypothetical protein